MAPGHHLTPAQQRVLARLSAGPTVTAAAFREALIEIRREQARSLAGQALSAIQAVLADPQAPTIARAIGYPARNQPCPCGSGRKFKRCCMSTH
jgi:uncharacterized protein YecA (UPF0149 family)